VARAAVAAGLDNDFIAFLHVGNARADACHDASRFIAGHERELDLLADGLDGLKVGGAETAGFNAHNGLARRAWVWERLPAPAD